MSQPPEQVGKEIGGDASDPLRAQEIAAWMERYGAALRRYFARKASPADAEDLVQEVFLRLQRRNASEPVANVERYLFRTAKHVLLNRNRHERTDGLWWHGSLDRPGLPADDLSPERIVAGRQDAERAVIAILNLPPRMRAVFEAHRFEKLSYAAIAARMGLSKTVVGRLMQQAIERLSEEFRDKP